MGVDLVGGLRKSTVIFDRTLQANIFHFHLAEALQ